jgi:hypothetical protein
MAPLDLEWLGTLTGHSPAVVVADHPNRVIRRSPGGEYRVDR